MLLLELDDVDGTFAHAVERGATIEMPVAEMFWGERYGIVRDPFPGIAGRCTRREQLAPDEVARSQCRLSRPTARGRTPIEAEWSAWVVLGTDPLASARSRPADRRPRRRC